MSAFWTDAEVRAALGLEGAAGDIAFASVSTDTRTIEPGALFVALVGERFDGHDYVAEAHARGARGAVVSRRPEGVPEDFVVYRVEDTLRALGDLARHYRRSLPARVCAVVGSNGKTTTKELVRAALEPRYRVHATRENLNNLIGVPLTVLAAPRDAEALVVEAGTNAPGEIDRLGEILEPDAVIVTAIAEEHLEGLGDLAGVLEEESSMLRHLTPGGLALVAPEPSELVERARELAGRVLVAEEDASLRAEDVRLDDEGRVSFRWEGVEVGLEFRGRVHARNALYALGLAREWGVDPAAAAAALRTVQPFGMRSEVRRYGELTVLVDCYNANPASVEAAVELLGSLPRRGGRVVVVGSMRELGSASAALHRRVAERIATSDVDLVVATGDFAEAFAGLESALEGRLIRVEDPLEAYGPLVRRLGGSETVLLKGSRGVALERLLPRFEADFGNDDTGLRNGAAPRHDAAGAATGE